MHDVHVCGIFNISKLGSIDVTWALLNTGPDQIDSVQIIQGREPHRGIHGRAI